ncbi:MAG: histidine kinase [Hyphomicrobiales bacterium]|nr:MAG: histidine kinase [Hyphomicrobiales bacterium]
MAHQPSPTVQLALDLALAVISSSDTPLLMLDGDLAIVAASRSFCRAFQINPSNATGRQMAHLGSGEWDVPQLDSLLKATASGYAEVEGYELSLQRPDRPARKLVINAHKLKYDGDESIRLLLSVADVTEARKSEKLRDELLREKAILLQELQHRVANRLQVIASVLLQSARKIVLNQNKTHLSDPIDQAMSVMALQQQIATSQLGDVVLRPYLTNLCRSIGASMIRDRDLLTLEVSVDDSIAVADVSICLGLVVTELVINALKHAFPGQRPGIITVEYRSSGAEWTLSVADNGVGMPKEAGAAKAGLGSNIVNALAAQLDSEIEVKDVNPGTVVTLTHVPQIAINGPLVRMLANGPV